MDTYGKQTGGAVGVFIKVALGVLLGMVPGLALAFALMWSHQPLFTPLTVGRGCVMLVGIILLLSSVGLIRPFADEKVNRRR